MINRSRHFMKQLATVLRPSIAIDITTIRDRVLQGYTTVSTTVKIYLEHTGGNLVRHGQLGMIPLHTFTAFVGGNEDILTNDILKVDGTYYAVEDVEDFSNLKWHKRLSLVERNFTQAQE